MTPTPDEHFQNQERLIRAMIMDEIKRALNAGELDGLLNAWHRRRRDDQWRRRDDQ